MTTNPIYAALGLNVALRMSEVHELMVDTIYADSRTEYEIDVVYDGTEYTLVTNCNPAVLSKIAGLLEMHVRYRLVQTYALQGSKPQLSITGYTAPALAA